MTNDYVNEQITAALETAQESGFSLPWHLAAIGCNGALVYSRYDRASDDSLEYTNLLEHIPGNDGLKAPVNIVLVDSAGEAIRIVLNPNPFSKN